MSIAPKPFDILERPAQKTVEKKVYLGKPGRDGIDGKDGKDGVDGRHGKDGKDGIDGKDGLNGKDALEVNPAKIAEILNTLEDAIEAKTIKGFVTAADVIQEIRNLKGNERLDISNIRNGEQLAQAANKQKVDMNDMRWHGSGGSSVSVPTVKTYSLSSQLNGVTKSFTIPSNSAVTGVFGSSAPFVFDYTTDYTGSGTTTLTFTSNVDAPSALAAGQTLIINYY